MILAVRGVPTDPINYLIPSDPDPGQTIAREAHQGSARACDAGF